MNQGKDLWYTNTHAGWEIKARRASLATSQTQDYCSNVWYLITVAVVERLTLKSILKLPVQFLSISKCHCFSLFGVGIFKGNIYKRRDVCVIVSMFVFSFLFFAFLVIQWLFAFWWCFVIFVLFYSSFAVYALFACCCLMIIYNKVRFKINLTLLCPFCTFLSTFTLLSILFTVFSSCCLVLFTLFCLFFTPFLSFLFFWTSLPF